ncbi:SH3 domain-containing protein [Paenilisteria newyorkensis]|uniref:SH3 domain-containing protein n=1 Tax=Listeria newyorkensis TaxID=1497681 RepID=UPI00235859A0|nr:SH3 domain-containing protein [Listeria newyorkensis]WAO20816.1 SH3 domain-containing protein [Listeria newyorkensis]
MKKLIITTLIVLLFFATPVATQATIMKEVVTQKQNVYSKQNARGVIVGYVYRGSVVKYDTATKQVIYRNVKGYLNTTYYLAPAKINTWCAAVVTSGALNLRTQPNTSGKVITTLANNEVIRVNTGAMKNGWYPVAYNRAGYWNWEGWINSKYVVRVDGFGYDSLAQFSTL